MRPARAVIDLEAIRHNYRLARRLAPQSRALAIIKANAYGHGAVKVARALAAEADGFGVACLEEAMELRDAGIGNRILLLEGVFTPDEIVQVDNAGLDMVLHTQEQLDCLLAARPQRKLDVFLKIDTGMHRLGFAPERVKRTFAALQTCTHVGTITLMSHFARADEVDDAYTGMQMQRFQQAIQGISAPVSLANSAGILAWPASHADCIRPGLMLYGASPMQGQGALPAGMALRPAMRLESAIIAIHELSAGEPVGYGGRFCADMPMTVATVAMGYADGYPRHAVDGTPIAINGRRTRIAGRVSMDMLTLDVSGMDAKVGDRVELWGGLVAPEEVAACSATIPYTLFTGITRRVPLHYVEA